MDMVGAPALSSTLEGRAPLHVPGLESEALLTPRLLDSLMADSRAQKEL